MGHNQSPQLLDHSESYREINPSHDYEQIWNAAIPLAAGHAQYSWSEDQIRWVPEDLDLYIADVQLSGSLLYSRYDAEFKLSGLYIRDLSNDYVRALGHGLWSPASSIPYAAKIWFVDSFEVAATITSIGLYAVAYLHEYDVKKQMPFWLKKGYIPKILNYVHQQEGRWGEYANMVVGLIDFPCWRDSPDQIKSLLGYGEIDLQQKAQLQLQEWHPPTDYMPESVAIPPYPLHVFPSIAHDAIVAIAEYVQVPYALAGQSVLGAMAYCAQDQINAPDIHHPDGMPVSLFLLTEGESGSRKTATQQLSDYILIKAERQRIEQYQSDLRDYQRLSRKDRELTPPPVNPKTLYKDATIEPVISALIRDDVDSVMLSSDEAGQFFGGYSLRSEASRATMGILTTLYSTGLAERTRSAANADGSGSAYDKRLSISLLGQKEVLKPALTDPVMRGQGLLPRFLFAAPESMAGTRFLTESSLRQSIYNDKRMQYYWERCSTLLGYHDDHLPRALGRTETKRLVLTMSDAANQVWLDFFNQTELLQAKGRAFESLRAFASRAGENARRVAAIFSFFEGQSEINATLMQSACELVEYSLGEWKRYTDHPEIDPFLLAVAHLESWLISKAENGRVLRSTALKNHPSRLLRQGKVQAFDKALHVLEEHCRLKQVLIDGKMQIVINPCLVCS